MKIKINIKDKIVCIALTKNRRVLDQMNFPEENNLSEKLLPAIDKLLKQNKLNSRDINRLIVKTDTPGSFTTSRIAKAVEKAWNFKLNKL